jgi:hypothetical protein
MQKQGPQLNLMSEYNLKRLDGIFFFSVFSAFTLSVLIYTGLDVSETGIAITLLEAFGRLFPPNLAWIVPALAIVLTLVDLAYLGKSILQISERGYGGAFASGTGFFGALFLFLGSMFRIDVLPYIGIVVLLAGIIVIRFSTECDS